LFRTGNFDLTETHFHWVKDIEIEPNSETLPEWALVVERIEWGRFYGTPKEFAIRHERPIIGDEQSLLAMIQFYESNQWRLTAEELDALNDAVKPLRGQYEKVRTEKVARFLELIESNSGKRIDAVVDSSQVTPVAEASDDRNVTELQEVWPTPESAWGQFGEYHDEVRDRYHERRKLEKHDIGRVNSRVEGARLDIRRQEIDHRVFVLDTANEMLQVQNELDALAQALEKTTQTVAGIKGRFRANSELIAFADRFAANLREENTQQGEAPRERLKVLEAMLAQTPRSAQDAVHRYIEVTNEASAQTAELMAKIEEIRNENARYELRMVTAQGQEKTLCLGDIVRAYPANQLSGSDKAALYFARWGEFLQDDPREANSEGGVFPAIWGTVVMTLIMALFVVPFGVLAALYLREYAKAGPIVSAVRISINNLAGVPSIVFGVFGMGFFCYLVGAYLDGGPANANMPVWPKGIWFGVLFALVGVSVGAFLFSLYSIAGRHTAPPPPAKRLAGKASVVAWLVSAAMVVLLIATTPFFGGWFETNLPNPKFGKGGLLWSSLTLALLTLPVVIVATEEALSAVPNSLREGSYACGAGKWQTIRRVVLPHAMPGIMTGMILAMARGAGEVAPLMFVGAVKLAPELPVDTAFPFVHADRSFMHLGFHVYDLGFQSQNSEAAKPMVFTTTLLLIVIIALLNVMAVWLRSRLRRRFVSSAF
jgi:ABC-type phosphate transport system permease subunit